MKSLTNSIQGEEEKTRHNEILEGLYKQGWAEVEYFHKETPEKVC